jgi:hypothetical protein
LGQEPRAGAENDPGRPKVREVRATRSSMPSRFGGGTARALSTAAPLRACGVPADERLDSLAAAAARLN